MAATASYRAVPSILIVAPMGRTKRVILLSILLFSSRHRNVTGNVAELKRQVNWSDYKKPSKHKPFSFEMLQAKAENEDGR